MQLVDLLVELRRSILGAVRGVQNANGSLFWDTTTPNATTREQLRGLLRKALTEAESFGVYRVTVHCPCGRAEHKDYLIEPGTHGIRERADSAFKWPGTQLYQGDRISPCACTPLVHPSKHWVIDELVVRCQGATSQHDRLLEALYDVQQAIDIAGDKRRRSGIREHLLRAVLTLNDGILPQSVDEYIASLGGEAKA